MEHFRMLPCWRRGPWLAGLPLVLLLLCSSVTSQAGDPKVESARYFGRGNAAYDAGNYEEAVRMFRVSIALTPDLAGPHRRIGQALKKLNRCEEALDHFLTYLRLKPDGTYSDEIRQEMAQCAASGDATDGKPLPGVASGVLRLSIGIDGALVKVDGLEMGSSPIPPLTLKAGIHRIEVSHPDFLDTAETVDLAGGEQQEVAIHMQQRQQAEQATPVKQKARPVALWLTIVPNGVRVKVDGKLVGLSPVGLLALEPGSHTLQLSKPGFLPEEHVLDAEEGQPIELELRMMRLEGAEGLAGLVEEAPPSLGPASPAGAAAPDLVAPAPGQPPGWLAWTAIGGGAACMAGGFLLGSMAMSRAADYADSGPSSDRRSLRASGQKLALAADLLGGGGLALALGGVVLKLMSGDVDAAAGPAGALRDQGLRPAVAGMAGSAGAGRHTPTLGVLAGPGFWGVGGSF